MAYSYTYTEIPYSTEELLLARSEILSLFLKREHLAPVIHKAKTNADSFYQLRVCSLRSLMDHLTTLNSLFQKETKRLVLWLLMGNDYLYPAEDVETLRWVNTKKTLKLSGLRDEIIAQLSLKVSGAVITFPYHGNKEDSCLTFQFGELAEKITEEKKQKKQNKKPTEITPIEVTKEETLEKKGLLNVIDSTSSQIDRIIEMFRASPMLDGLTPEDKEQKIQEKKRLLTDGLADILMSCKN